MFVPTARDRLLDAAERLFAERGLAAVSLRSINAAADLSPAALHYHFGSKPALVEALLERRMSVLMGRRAELLDAAEAAIPSATARDVIETLVRPIAELLSSEDAGGRRYLRLLSRLHADGDLDTRFVAEHYPSGIDRLEPLLQRALPQHPRSVVRLRLALAIDIVLRSLGQWDELAALWRGDDADLSLDDVVSSVVDFVTGGLEAPLRSQAPSTTRLRRNA